MITFVEDTKALANAANSKFITSRGSAFLLDGSVFSVGSLSFRRMPDATEKDPSYPGFYAEFGDGVEHKFLFYSMFTKERVNYKGEILTPNGTFNQLYRKMVNAGECFDAAFHDRMLRTMSGYKVKVVRVPYVYTNARGVNLPSYYNNFQIIDDAGNVVSLEPAAPAVK